MHALHVLQQLAAGHGLLAVPLADVARGEEHVDPALGHAPRDVDEGSRGGGERAAPGSAGHVVQAVQLYVGQGGGQLGGVVHGLGLGGPAAQVVAEDLCRSHSGHRWEARLVVVVMVMVSPFSLLQVRSLLDFKVLLTAQ